MPVLNIPTFERFFRVAASLDVDKNDAKRYSEFVNGKLHDLMLMAQATARANDRGLVEPHDLPITKGLQESIYRFRRLDEEVELTQMLKKITDLPQIDLLVAEETEQRIPEIAGGLSYALAQTFKIVDPKVKNPATDEWERSFRIFDLLL